MENTSIRINVERTKQVGKKMKFCVFFFDKRLRFCLLLTRTILKIQSNLEDVGYCCVVNWMREPQIRKVKLTEQPTLSINRVENHDI